MEGECKMLVPFVPFPTTLSPLLPTSLSSPLSVRPSQPLSTMPLSSLPLRPSRPRSLRPSQPPHPPRLSRPLPTPLSPPLPTPLSSLPLRPTHAHAPSSPREDSLSGFNFENLHGAAYLMQESDTSHPPLHPPPPRPLPD